MFLKKYLKIHRFSITNQLNNKVLTNKKELKMIELKDMLSNSTQELIKLLNNNQNNIHNNNNKDKDLK